MTLELFSPKCSQILECNFAWQAQCLVRLEGDAYIAPRNVNDVSYVTGINHESHFTWQAQYLVTLVDDICCSAHCK